jgi:hypothetical protein
LAYARVTWSEFVDRTEPLHHQLPGDPKVESITYKTAKGTSLPAKVYTAQDARGTYKVTVVNYATATGGNGDARDEAAQVIRAKGEVKYDAQEDIDRITDQRITVVLAGQRAASIERGPVPSEPALHHEAETGINTPPPAQFQASIRCGR